MNAALRARLALTGLIIFALWPLFHRGLVRDQRIAVFCLMAMSSDAAAVLPLTTTVEVLAGEQRSPLPDGVGDAEIGRLLRAWHHRTALLGYWAWPDAVAQRILALRPTLPGLAITTTRQRIDRRTGKIATDDVRFEFRRGGDHKLDVCVQKTVHMQRQLRAGVDVKVQ